jgi:hypothetical protein
VKTVAASDKIATQLPLSVILPISNSGLLAREVMHGDVLNFKKDLAPARHPGIVQVLENFTLGVDGDAFATGEVLEVNAVAAAFKAQLDSVVNQAFAFQAFTEAHRGEQVDRPLF